MSAANKTHVCGFEFEEEDPNSALTLLYNDTTTHALPIFFQQTVNALAGTNLTVTSAPWPFSDGLTWDSSIFTTVLLLGIALSIPAGMCMCSCQYSR